MKCHSVVAFVTKTLDRPDGGGGGEASLVGEKLCVSVHVCVCVVSGAST